MTSLNDMVDALLFQKRTRSDEVQAVINPDVLFRYNSVNLVIGKRGSGKTYMIGREILKLALLDDKPYTQVYYVTDKERDDTFEFIQKVCPKWFQICWIKTENAVKLIETMSKAKAKMLDEKWSSEHQDKVIEIKKALNVQEGQELPHTMIVFDDCIGLFKKDSNLSKKLFENRQSRITYILALQDVSGISPSMKSNIDSMVLFGELPKHKFNILTYQMPPEEGCDWETYSRLMKEDYMFVDYVDGSVQTVYRDGFEPPFNA